MEEEDFIELSQEQIDKINSAATPPPPTQEGDDGFYDIASPVTSGFDGDSQYNTRLFRDSDEYKQRAQNQPWYDQLGNATGRVLLNTIPSIIGNFASILDVEDYLNQDDEVGNALTKAMDNLKGAVNEELAIYRERPDRPLDLGDSAWWFENGSGIVESALSFVGTGYGLGALTKAGLGSIKWLSTIEKVNAVEGIAGALTSVGLNQAESISSATYVYDNIYTSGLKLGLSEEEAKSKAADAASHSININRANILLNLTSTKALIKSPKNLSQAFRSKGLLKSAFAEGAQEYGEETINFIAEKEALRKANADLEGKDYEASIDNIINDVSSLEGIEAGVLGFIGGVAQTAAIKKLQKFGQPSETEEDGTKFNEPYITELEKGLKDAGIVTGGEVASLAKELSPLLNEKHRLVTEGGESLSNNQLDRIKDIDTSIEATKAFYAYKNGSEKVITETYKQIEGLNEEEAIKQGFTGEELDPDSEYYYKKRAKASRELTESLGKVYKESESYVNSKEVYENRVSHGRLLQKSNVLKSELNQTTTQFNLESDSLPKSKALASKLPTLDINNLSEQVEDVKEAINEDEDLSVGAKLSLQRELDSYLDKVENLPSYKKYEDTTQKSQELGNQVNKINEAYSEAISEETQEALIQEAEQEEATNKAVEEMVEELPENATLAELSSLQDNIKEQKGEESKEYQILGEIIRSKELGTIGKINELNADALPDVAKKDKNIKTVLKEFAGSWNEAGAFVPELDEQGQNKKQVYQKRDEDNNPIEEYALPEDVFAATNGVLDINTPNVKVGDKVIVIKEPNWDFWKSTSQSDVVYNIYKMDDQGSPVGKPLSQIPASNNEKTSNQPSKAFRDKGYEVLRTTISYKNQGDVINQVNEDGSRKQNKLGDLQYEFVKEGEEWVKKKTPFKPIIGLGRSGGMVDFMNLDFIEGIEKAPEYHEAAKQAEKIRGKYRKGLYYVARLAPNERVIPLALTTSTVSGTEVEYLKENLGRLLRSDQTKLRELVYIPKVGKDLKKSIQNVEESGRFLMTEDSLFIKHNKDWLELSFTVKEGEDLSDLEKALEGLKGYEFNRYTAKGELKTPKSKPRGKHAEISNSINDQLGSQLKNIMAEKLNTSESYIDPITGEEFESYFDYVSETKSLTTDLPQGNAFTNSSIYLKPEGSWGFKKKSYAQLEQELEEIKVEKGLETQLRDYLSDIGVKVEVVEDMRAKYGIEATGVADITNMVVEVAKGDRGINALPEEAAHFMVESLENTPLLQEMIEKVEKLPEYTKTKELYNELYEGDEYKLKKEAVGQVIAKRWIDGQKISRGWFQKLLDKLRNVVNTVFGKTDVFQEVADLIKEEKVNQIQPKGQGQFFQIDTDKLSQLSSVVNSSIQSLRQRVRVTDRTKPSKFKEKMQEYLKEIQQQKGNKVLATYIKIAAEEVNYSRKRLNGALNPKFEFEDISADLIVDLNNRLATYDILEDIKAYVRKNPLAKSLKEAGVLEQIEDVLTNKGNIEEDLKEESIKLTAKWVQSNTSENLDYNYVEDQLRIADKDVDIINRYLGANIDSRDELLRVMAKVVLGSKEEARLKSEDLLRNDGGWLDRNQEYENWAASKGIKVNNLKAKYDPILEYDIEGEVQFVQEASSEVINEEKRLKGLIAEGEPGSIWDQFYDKYYTGEGESRKLKPQYISDKYKAIQADPKLSELYSFFVNNYLDSQKTAPIYSRPGYRIPSIRKELLEIAGDAKGKAKLNVFREAFIDSIKRTYDETDRAEGDGKNLPVRFISKKIEKGETSLDVFSTTFLFIDEMNRHESMQKELSQLELVQKIAQERLVKKTRRKNILTDETVETGEVIEGSQSNASKQIDSLMRRMVYGALKQDEGGTNILGVEVDFAKLTDTIIKYTGLRTLALNLNVGLSNIATGEATILQEAVGGKWFGLKDYVYATKKFATEVVPYMKDYGKRKITNKLGLVMEKYDVLDQVRLNPELGKKTSRVKAALDGRTLSVANSIGEVEMRGRGMLAMMNKIKLKNTSGEEINLYDAYEVKGEELVMKEGLTYEGRKFTEDDFAFIRNKMNKVNQTMHGIYNTIDSPGAKEAAWGRLVLTMRGWLKPSLDRRWKVKHFDERLGEYNEGNYVSAINFFQDQFGRKGVLKGQISNLKYLFGLGLDSVDLLTESERETLSPLQQKDLTETRKANIKKTLTELYSILLLSTLITGAFDGDDKDSLLFYQMVRLRRELTTMSQPYTNLWDIVKTPTVVLGQMDGLVDFVYDSTVGVATGDVDGEKIKKRLQKTVPLYSQWGQFEDLDKKADWFIRAR